jgi:putative oxidoreductase
MMQTPNAEHATPNVEWSSTSALSAVSDQPSGTRPFVWRTVAILIGALFVYAGVLKAWEPVRFAGDIENYHILPWAVNVRLAFYLPWVEIICGLALIFRRLFFGALAILLSLMVVFIGATIAAKMRGIDISCGCFGHVSDQLGFAWHLVLDFAIFAGLIASWKWDRGKPALSHEAIR